MGRVKVHYDDLVMLEQEIELAEAKDERVFFFKFFDDERMFQIAVEKAKKLLGHLQIQYSCNPVQVTVEIDQFIDGERWTDDEWDQLP